MSTSRTRQRDTAGPEGTYFSTLPVSQSVTRSCTLGRDTCQDVVPGPDQYFNADHRGIKGHLLNFDYAPVPERPWERKIAVNFPLGFFVNPVTVLHQSISGRPPNSTLAVSLLRATNPSKPVIDLPVSLLELRELPSLVKNAGDTLIRKYASRNLLREFGWTPLASDAKAMLTIAAEVAKRVELFKQLRERPLLRKATLWKGSFVSEPRNTVTSNSSPSQVTVTHMRTQYTTKVVIGGYVRWTPDAVFTKGNLDYADPALEYLARRAVVGGQLGLVTAWNAIPWTWLIDWFGNIGDWLEANRHVVPASPSTPRLTVYSKSTELWTVVTSNINATTGGIPVERYRENKERIIASATLPSAYLPLLTQRQVGILASLAILRT